LKIAELVYGTPESPRVAVVVAENADETFTLYVDANRDRKVNQRDLVEGKGPLRLLPLAAQQIVDFVVNEFPRKVLIRWQPGSASVDIATASTIDRTVEFEGLEENSKISIRQVDGNANGLFADAKSLLGIDINADGRDRQQIAQRFKLRQPFSCQSIQHRVRLRFS
jgi:hypothetical protein